MPRQKPQRVSRNGCKSASADRCGRGTLHGKVGKRLPEGCVSGAAKRQRICEANEQRRRPATACLAGMPQKGAVSEADWG